MLLAVDLTVGINLAVGSFVTITLPSLVIPFGGPLTGGVRAVSWGVLLSPQSAGGVGLRALAIGILFPVLLILEGQGYILALFGAYRHGRAFLWPRSLGAAGRRQRYRRGVKDYLRIYALVTLVLLVAALYEVGLAIVAAPALLQ